MTEIARLGAVFAAEDAEAKRLARTGHTASGEITIGRLAELLDLGDDFNEASRQAKELTAAGIDYDDEGQVIGFQRGGWCGCRFGGPVGGGPW